MNSAFAPLKAVQSTLADALDIIDGRVDDERIPDWCMRRGWSEFLLQLSDSDLKRCEAAGLHELAHLLPGIPASLLELAQHVLESCRLPRLSSAAATLPPSELRGVSSRKRQQLSALLGVLGPFAREAQRIVDVGAGSGHFTRLSARLFERDSLGLERNPKRVEQARSRVAREPDDGRAHTARYTVIDLGREPLQLYASDLAIGLHACGALGDGLVRAVTATGADLLLVSCCLQKIPDSERTALSRAAGDLRLKKHILGLSNLTSQDRGVESGIEHTMRARQARYGLRLLLLGRGLEVAPGAEMHGINRRRAHAGLSDLARQALSDRGLDAAAADEIAAYERAAVRIFGVVRRLSLPRNMLARLVELSVILDRAACLEESGSSVVVATLFERAVTPRNIGLFASRDASRLPRVRAGLA